MLNAPHRVPDIETLMEWEVLHQEYSNKMRDMFCYSRIFFWVSAPNARMVDCVSLLVWLAD